MISIIGAGPAGSQAAKHLAEKGEQVKVIEEHSSIGRPVQCTGIVTQSIKEEVGLRNSLVINKLRKVRLHAPDRSTAEIKLSDIVIDRTKFDQHLAEEARKKGVRILLNNRVTGIKKSRLKIKNTKTKRTRTVTTDTIIGADGPNSLVSRYIGNQTPAYWTGVQAVAQMRVDKTAYDVYFGKEFPGFFGWVVPENEGRARIGTAVPAGHNPRKTFDRFIKRFEKYRVLEMQGGLIPRYDPKIRVSSEGVYIIGDAATQVKATTGGGLVPGLKAARCLANAISNNTSYPKELRKVNKELRTSLMLRNVLDRFTDEDHNRLIELVNNENIKRLLDKEDRDRPTKIVFKSVMKEPRLLLFAKTLFRAKCL